MKSSNLVAEQPPRRRAAAAAGLAHRFSSEPFITSLRAVYWLVVVLCIGVSFIGCAAAAPKPEAKPRCGVVGRLPLLSDEVLLAGSTEPVRGDVLRFIEMDGQHVAPCMVICTDGQLRWINLEVCQ